MTGPRRFGPDDRAVSIAVTHVLTIGITTILLTGLLIGAGGVLDSEREQAARSELKTIGDRLSAEMESIDRTATPDADERIELETEHPSRVSGAAYTVRLESKSTGSACDVNRLDNASACLIMSTAELNDDVVVPVNVHEDTVDPGAVNGGDVRIVYENEPGDDPTITIESAT
ncbi:hypothetical protein [Halostella sp. PRR32]|uniref:DUF7266 family protein n=1 Tax=Halostella sp. PRR32 TaxID=3098147 RepID=UPI002B1CF268|nr:hypothetical protein [Halostella sp. PRR32]